MIGTLLSWILNAKYPENIRVVILADDDDEATKTTFESWKGMLTKFCSGFCYDR